MPALGRDACDIEKDQEMALSAVGGDQAEGRLGPGRGDADGQGSGPHRRKAADPLVPHHREGGDGPAIGLDAAGFDALAGGQVFPQHHAGDRLFLREGQGQGRAGAAGGGLPIGAGQSVGRQGGRMVWGERRKLCCPITILH